MLTRIIIKPDYCQFIYLHAAIVTVLERGMIKHVLPNLIASGYTQIEINVVSQRLFTRNNRHSVRTTASGMV